MIEPAAYRRLAAALRADIEAGRYAPGEALPSESALEREHGHGRDTVRDAIALLRAWGLVSVQHGRGSFVRERPTPEVIRMSEVTRISARMPTAAEQDQWDLDDGTPVLVVARGGETAVYPADRTVLEF